MIFAQHGGCDCTFENVGKKITISANDMDDLCNQLFTTYITHNGLLNSRACLKKYHTP